MLPGLEGIFEPTDKQDRWRGPNDLALAFMNASQTSDPGWRILRRGVLIATCNQALPGVLPAADSLWRTGLWPTSPELGGGFVVLDFW